MGIRFKPFQPGDPAQRQAHKPQRVTSFEEPPKKTRPKGSVGARGSQRSAVFSDNGDSLASGVSKGRSYRDFSRYDSEVRPAKPNDRASFERALSRCKSEAREIEEALFIKERGASKLSRAMADELVSKIESLTPADSFWMDEKDLCAAFDKTNPFKYFTHLLSPNRDLLEDNAKLRGLREKFRDARVPLESARSARTYEQVALALHSNGLDLRFASDTVDRRREKLGEVPSHFYQPRGVKDWLTGGTVQREIEEEQGIQRRLLADEGSQLWNLEQENADLGLLKARADAIVAGGGKDVAKRLFEKTGLLLDESCRHGLVRAGEKKFETAKRNFVEWVRAHRDDFVSTHSGSGGFLELSVRELREELRAVQAEKAELEAQVGAR